MNFKTSIILTFGLLLCRLGFSQADGGNPIEKRAFYQSHYVYGALVHTSGYGAYFRRGWRQTGYSNKILNIEFVSIKHPKEIKLNTINNQYARNYFYGKLNSVAFLRPSYGWQKVMFDKEVDKGVRVSYHFLFGPTVGFVKPIYLVVQNDNLGLEPKDVKASYDVYRNNSVIGRASYLRGLTETSLRLGIHMKYALTFEFSKDDESIKALELGTSFDGFIREIPIMSETYNNRFFVNIYLAYHLGKRLK